MSFVVSNSECACLVHSWLIQSGFNKTASIFINEAKDDLQNISVNGSIRNLTHILSDYARLKQKEIQKSKMQSIFYENEENCNQFTEIWNEFNQLINDYKYLKKQGNEMIINDNKSNKKRKLNDNFELNTKRFNQLLKDNELHKKMAQLINNKENKTDFIDKMMNEYEFDELFVPLPIDSDI